VHLGAAGRTRLAGTATRRITESAATPKGAPSARWSCCACTMSALRLGFWSRRGLRLMPKPHRVGCAFWLVNLQSVTLRDTIDHD
jgi:hypothetical protein